MIFMKVIQESGALDAIASLIIQRFHKVPALMLIFIMIIIMFPGMITGSSTASVLSAGSIMAPVLMLMGVPVLETACILALGGVLGMIAPPTNIPAMIIGAGIDIPYSGFGLPLTMLTFPLAFLFVLMFGYKYVKNMNYVEVEAKLNTDSRERFGFKVYIPLLLAIVLMVLNKAVPAIPDIGMPLVFLILSSVLNVILDLWFIAALGMGVAGAGVATVISQGVSVALCILYVFRSARLLLPEKKHFHVESRLYWELFSQSISMGLMSSIVSAGSVVLQYGINGLGTLVIAGHTAARKLFAFTDMPLTAMASACSTYVSQNYGANHPDRVRRGMRDIYLYGVVVAVTAILLMSVGAEWMVKLVSGSSEPVVLENGARYLVWNAPFYAVLGMLLSTRYALQSMGEKVLPLLSSVIEFLGKIVFVLLFIPRFEYNAVILCEPVIWCFMTIELLIAYRHNSFVFPKMKK